MVGNRPKELPRSGAGFADRSHRTMVADSEAVAADRDPGSAGVGVVMGVQGGVGERSRTWGALTVVRHDAQGGRVVERSGDCTSSCSVCTAARLVHADAIYGIEGRRRICPQGRGSRSVPNVMVDYIISCAHVIVLTDAAQRHAPWSKWLGAVHGDVSRALLNSCCWPSARCEGRHGRGEDEAEDTRRYLSPE